MKKNRRKEQPHSGLKRQKKEPVRVNTVRVDAPREAKRKHTIYVGSDDYSTRQSMFPLQNYKSLNDVMKAELKNRKNIIRDSQNYPQELQTFLNFQSLFNVEEGLEKDMHNHGVVLSMRSPQTTNSLAGALAKFSPPKIDVTKRDWEAGDNEISMNSNSGYVVGRHSKEREMIPIERPNHISFAHEAKHILDKKQGNYSPNAVNIPFYSNTNEIKVIGKRGDFKKGEVTENAFREEAGLPVRYGHFGWQEKPDQNSFNNAIFPIQRQYPGHLFKDQDFLEERRQLKENQRQNIKAPQRRGGWMRWFYINNFE